MARGRPRKTDPNNVLDIVMITFWKRGFEETSMNDLSKATGMAKPGLYATFGNKEALYAKALERYSGQIADPMNNDIVSSPDPLEVVLRRYLDRVASTVMNKAGPKGCFIANSLVECSNMPPSLEALSKASNELRLAAFVKRMKAEKKQGALPADADVKALSSFFSGQVLAVTVMARAGASKRSLNSFIEVVMTALPARTKEITDSPHRLAVPR